MTLQPNENFSKDRRNPTRSFTLRYQDDIECCVCFEIIEVGSLVRYNPEGLIVHVRHRKPEPVAGKPCPSCWLVHAGECDR